MNIRIWGGSFPSKLLFSIIIIFHVILQILNDYRLMMVLLKRACSCPYAVLGLNRSASRQQVKEAFRNLAKKTHPDVEGGSEEKFKKVNQAYKKIQNQSGRSQANQQSQASYQDYKTYYRSYDRPYTENQKTNSKALRVACLIFLISVICKWIADSVSSAPYQGLRFVQMQKNYTPDAQSRLKKNLMAEYRQKKYSIQTVDVRVWQPGAKVKSIGELQSLGAKKRSD